jgi:hypothetical protein
VYENVCERGERRGNKIERKRKNACECVLREEKLKERMQCVRRENKIK